MYIYCRSRIHLFCSIVSVIVISSLSIHFAILDRDSSCQEGHRAGMFLYEWLLIDGIMALAMVGVVAITLIFRMTFALTCTESRIYLYNLFSFLYALFVFTWTIIGIVILATNENNNCVAQGKGMAVMSIITIVIGSGLQANLAASIFLVNTIADA